MHEASIAAPLLRIVLEEYGRHHPVERGPGIRHIRVSCGILLGIEETTLKGCFAIMAEGTAAENAVLDLRFLPMRGVCRSCSAEVETVRRAFACPACNAHDVAWCGGRELVVEGITVFSPLAEERTAKDIYHDATN